MIRKNNNALILFVKAPRIGTVKTRLQLELTPEQSLLLYRAMVEDTVRQFKHVGFCDLKIFFDPADADGEMKTWLGDQLEYFPQQGDDLGKKMHHAIAEMLNQKYEKAVLVGSDIPRLGATTIVRAFSSLVDNDLVIGPCKDGGYYLIGMKQPHPVLFEEIAWSSNVVLHQTMRKAEKAELEVMQIELKSDIDTYAEVEKLWEFLQRQNTKNIGSLYQNKTYETLKNIFKTEQTSSKE